MGSGILKRIIIYLFPIYLIAVEYSIRFLLSYVPGKAEDLGLVSLTSTIATAGLVLITPVLIPKPANLTEQATRDLRDKGAVAVRGGDGALIAVGVFALLVLPFPWGFALWLVHKETTAYDLFAYGLHFPTPLLIALVIYAIGIILTEWKEVA